MCSFDVGSPGNEKLKDGLGPRLQTAPRVNASVLRVFILEMMYTHWIQFEIRTRQNAILRLTSWRLMLGREGLGTRSKLT